MSGVLLALSFPRFGHPASAWVALVPLLVAVYRQPVRQAFVSGLASGVVYFSGTLYWMTRVMAQYGGLPTPVAAGVNALFVAYVALYPALFAVIMARLTRTGDVRALMMAPFVWVATELGRTYLFTGFPWVLLGYSQVTVAPVAQVASLAGVYGVSALVASVNAGLAIAVLGRQRGRMVLAPLAVALATASGFSVWGALRVARGALLTGDPVRVGLVQRNVDLAEKWDPARAPEIYTDQLRMTEDAVGRGAEFVLWPESSTPFNFLDDARAADRVRALARQLRVPVLLGSDEVERRERVRYYNSAFLIRPDGRDGGVYRKMHLVPFGEYVPRPFFFAGRLVEAVSDFSPGESGVLLPVRGHLTSAAICYEVVYPNLVRQGVAAGAELLMTITNDAWFGSTSAPYQHFAQASMRAIENGRYLVRSANTGVSGIVDPYGRVVASSPIFQQAVVVGDARFIRVSTVYTRTGDIFAYASAVATLLMLVAGQRSYKMKR